MYMCIWCVFLFPVQERSLEKLPPLPRPIVVLFVRLIECLLGSPPREDCLRYICDHLLVSDLNEVKFVSTPGTMDTSITNAFSEQQNRVHVVLGIYRYRDYLTFSKNSALLIIRHPLPND